MPTYSYVCKDCDHAFDVQQAFSDDSLTQCAECGGTLRKRYGSVGVVFKGSGFYRNDSRNGSGAPSSDKTPAKADSSSSSSSSSSSNGGSSSSGSSGSSSSSTAPSSGSAASTGSSKAAAGA